MRPMKEREGSDIVFPGGNPRWSPDGLKIAYDLCLTCEVGGNNFEIFVYDIITDKITQVTDHPGRDREPRWHLENDQLLFLSNRNHFLEENGTFVNNIFTYDFSNQEFSQLTDSVKVSRFAVNYTDNIVLAKPPFIVDNNNWFVYNLNQKKREEFSLPVNIDPGLSTPVIWLPKPKGNFLLFRIVSIGSEFSFSIMNINTQEIHEIPIPLTTSAGIDWHYEKN